MKLKRYISADYLRLQKALHRQPKGYGGRGDKWTEVVRNLAKEYECKSILDYGCGQGTLGSALRIRMPTIDIREYDPAISGKDGKVAPADLVVCTDVLEHIEPDKLGVVIDHLFRLTNKVLFLVIATRPSKKFLADGRNSHLIIEPDSWWLERLKHPLFRFGDPPSSPLDKPAREYIALLIRNA